MKNDQARKASKKAATIRRRQVEAAAYDDLIREAGISGADASKVLSAIGRGVINFVEINY